MNRLRPDYEKSNSYSTSLTKGLSDKMKKIGSEVEKIITLNGRDTESILIENNLVIIKGVLDSVPAFAHPFYYNNRVILDARAYTNKEGVVKDLADYHILVRRGRLEAAWIEERVEFASQIDLITDVFASWYSNGIAKRMNMSIQDNQILRILAAVYYMHFLHREEGCTPNEVNMILLKRLPRILRVPATVIDDVLDPLGEIAIANIYCYEGKDSEYPMIYHQRMIDAFNGLTGNTYRLSQSLVMASLTRGAFIAANGPEIAGMAIEHPPLFFLMVWYGLQKGSYGKTSIGMNALAVSRKHNEDGFNKFMNNVLALTLQRDNTDVPGR